MVFDSSDSGGVFVKPTIAIDRLGTVWLAAQHDTATGFQTVVRCFLRLPPDALRALASEREIPDSIAGWPLDGQVRAGIATLTDSELDGLERGDLVVLDEAPAERRLVCLPGLTLSGRHEDALFHVEEILMNEAWQQLPATLIVEIARVTLTLRELAALEVGAAFPIHSPRDGRVLLRIGERAVARGQLVEIDGALGVRIDDLLDGSEATT